MISIEKMEWLANHESNARTYTRNINRISPSEIARTLGFELIERNRELDELGHPQGDGKLVNRIKLGCQKEVLIVETGDRHGAVLRLQPPLITTTEDVEAILHRLHCRPDHRSKSTPYTAAALNIYRSI